MIATIAPPGWLRQRALEAHERSVAAAAASAREQAEATAAAQLSALTELLQRVLHVDDATVRQADEETWEASVNDERGELRFRALRLSVYTDSLRPYKLYVALPCARGCSEPVWRRVDQLEDLGYYLTHADSRHDECPREPTPDERDGMAWWNSLTDAERGGWLTKPAIQSAADAWAVYNGRDPQWSAHLAAEDAAERAAAGGPLVIAQRTKPVLALELLANRLADLAVDLRAIARGEFTAEIREMPRGEPTAETAELRGLGVTNV
jgi:hypothetical protein